MIEYDPPVYRPPGEWRSFLVQATIGCSHNGCTFCGMYKGKKFRIRSMDDIIGDIREAAAFYNQYEKVFLCDGDAIVMKTEDLLEIIGEIKKDFPHCRLISTYAGPRSTLSKTPEELKILHEAGLGRAYLGIETGMEALLKSTNKGVSRAEMLEAGLRLRNAGIDLWGIILIGLGGKPLSMENARETAKLINEMQPNHLSAMNYTPVEGTKLGNQALRGEFQVLSAKESLMETAELIRNLEVSGMHFTSDHASNYLPLKGTLNEDRDKLLRLIDGAIGGKVAVRSEASRGL
ncbi:MAG: radical SAM protein [Oscillospiraceae bacterium]|nr:radical SAM protein [Oscillospiraceae bacterium]